MSGEHKTIPISAIVPAFKRVEQTLVTIEKISVCNPAPDEILVHIDGGGDECAAAVEERFPEITIIKSDTASGPGGARNKLIAAARSEYVASFDDDSYPIDTDFFARLFDIFENAPEAAVITGMVFARGEVVEWSDDPISVVADFLGGGCAYRRSLFLQTAGYIPLKVGYGMEEVDVALQLHALGYRILKEPRLRVLHDTSYKQHASHTIVAGTIANVALLAWLRYPIRFWPRGCAQIINNIGYAISKGRFRGVVSGLLMIPSYLHKHSKYRKPISVDASVSFFELRKNPRVFPS